MLQSQFGWAEVTPKILSCGNTHEKVDVVGLAPYFGFEFVQGTTTLDEAMDSLIPASIEAVRAGLAAPLAAAATYGLPVATYEAGYGATGDGSSEDLAIAAARDPRMEQLYVDYNSMLVAEGVDLVMQFVDVSSYSRYGSWGLKEASDQQPQEAPKVCFALRVLCLPPGLTHATTHPPPFPRTHTY